MIKVELFGGPGDGQLLCIQGANTYRMVTGQFENGQFIRKIWYYKLKSDSDHNPDNGVFYFRLDFVESLIPKFDPYQDDDTIY